MVLQVLFVLLLFTIVHVVASAPAAGAVDEIAGVVTSQPVYSFTDVAVSSMALLVLGGSASGIIPVFSLLIALVVFAVGAYRARRLASADHGDSSSDSTPPCSDSDDEHSPILQGYRTYWASSRGEEPVTVPTPRSIRYDRRRLASADRDGSSSGSTQPCSPASSPALTQALDYSPVSDTPVCWDDPPDTPEYWDDPLGSPSVRRGTVLFGLMVCRCDCC
jgi:hypothetical protein